MYTNMHIQYEVGTREIQLFLNIDVDEWMRILAMLVLIDDWIVLQY